jgi:hypothetical protein
VKAGVTAGGWGGGGREGYGAWVLAVELLHTKCGGRGLVGEGEGYEVWGGVGGWRAKAKGSSRMPRIMGAAM